MPCQYLPASENSYHGRERGPGRGFTQPRPYAQHIHAREGAGSLEESGGREGGRVAARAWRWASRYKIHTSMDWREREGLLVTVVRARRKRARRLLSNAELIS